MFKIIGADGQEYGPVELAQIQQWIRGNRVNGQTMAQKTGETDWKPLSSFPELTAQFASAPPPLPGSLAPSPPFVAGIASAGVPTYLVPAILCTLLCCLPLGVPALVYAAKVGNKLAAGDIAGAQIASRNARTWCWVAFGVGVLWNIIAAIMFGAFWKRGF
jgi:hypothetical protein